MQHRCTPTNVGLGDAKLADPILLVDKGPLVELVVEAASADPILLVGIGPVVELVVKATTMTTMPAIPATTAIAINFAFDPVTFTRPISVSDSVI